MRQRLSITQGNEIWRKTEKAYREKEREKKKNEWQKERGLIHYLHIYKNELLDSNYSNTCDAGLYRIRQCKAAVRKMPHHHASCKYLLAMEKLSTHAMCFCKPGQVLPPFSSLEYTDHCLQHFLEGLLGIDVLDFYVLVVSGVSIKENKNDIKQSVCIFLRMKDGLLSWIVFAWGCSIVSLSASVVMV